MELLKRSGEFSELPQKSLKALKGKSNKKRLFQYFDSMEITSLYSYHEVKINVRVNVNYEAFCT